MGRTSVKANKAPYQKRREKLGYTREVAAERLLWITKERPEKIENEKSLVRPKKCWRWRTAMGLRRCATPIATANARLVGDTCRR